MKCVDYCHQGRISCPTPHTCGLPTRKLHTANSDGSSTGSATAPMPIDMEPDESDEQDNGARLSATEWALVIVALACGVFSLAMLAGYVMVKLS